MYKFYSLLIVCRNKFVHTKSKKKLFVQASLVYKKEKSFSYKRILYEKVFAIHTKKCATSNKKKQKCAQKLEKSFCTCTHTGLAMA